MDIKHKLNKLTQLKKEPADSKDPAKELQETKLKLTIQGMINKLTDVIEAKGDISLTVQDLLEFRAALLLLHVLRFKRDFDLKTKKEAEI